MLLAMGDNELAISARTDAAMYNTFAGNVNYIIKGIGNELAPTYTSDSLIVTLGIGEGIIKGRHVVEDISSGNITQLKLDPNTSGFLVLRYDVTNPIKQEVQLMSVNEVLNEDINADGMKCDLLLGEYVTNETGIVEFVDKRKIIEKVVDLSVIKEEITTIENSLGTQVTYSLSGTTLTITTK